MKRGRSNKDHISDGTQQSSGDYPQCTSIIIADFTTTIEDYAFYGWFNLTSVTIPSSVSHIGYRAFSRTPFTSVILPVGVRYVGERAFEDCRSLVSVVIDGSIDIGESAFSGCHSLVSVTGSINDIGRDAFSECSSLTSIDFGEDLINIGDWAFQGCRSPAYIKIPPSTTIRYEAFHGYTELERQATEAGLSVEEWGRSNWKWKKLETRFAIVSTVKKLNRCTDSELDALVVADGSCAKVGAALVFMVECGEEGLVRKIARYVE
jgi:hypothetical protein